MESMVKSGSSFALVTGASRGLGKELARELARWNYNLLLVSEYIDNIIQVNIRTTSLLTRLMLPELKSHRKAYILNVASMASFSPIAYKTIYPASKAFIWSFSRGLYEELKYTGVFVGVIPINKILFRRKAFSDNA